jgi:4-amino-4-deoxy-L-arabinose transferase-like glycosyltransferase
MNKTKLIFLGLVVLLAALSFLNRRHLYSELPFPGQSNDEYSNSWVGLSLVELGYPVGISGLAGAYEFNDYRYINVDRLFQRGYSGGIPSINYPWFDHPPLTGILIGGYAHLSGARVFEDTAAVVIRKPMILLGVVTAILAAGLALLVVGPVAALVTLAIYAVSPYIVITSRMIQAENFVTPLFLLSLIGLYQFEKTGLKKYFWLALVAAGSTMLFKLSGIGAIVAGSLLLLTFEKIDLASRLKLALLFFLLASSFILFFIVYGLSFDPKLFINVIGSNSDRIYGIGANAIHELIINSKLTNLHYLTDGWFFAGWLSFFVVSGFRHTRTKYLIIPVAIYLAVYLFFGSHPFGWYSFPFIPFLVIATAWIYSRALKSGHSLVPAILLSLMVVGIGLNRVVSQDEFAPYVSAWRLLMVAIFGLAVILQIKVFKHGSVVWISRLLLLLLILSGLYLSQEYFNSLTIESWFRIR